MDGKSDKNSREDLIRKRMLKWGIAESDLEESFVRSGGHGGQNVNKTSTCVMLRHIPSGLIIKCQETRYQGANRWIAREWLLDKLEEESKRKAAEAKSQQELERRRKRGRSRAAQLRILAHKSHQSAKKRERSRREFD